MVKQDHLIDWPHQTIYSVHLAPADSATKVFSYSTIEGRYGNAAISARSISAPVSILRQSAAQANDNARPQGPQEVDHRVWYEQPPPGLRTSNWTPICIRPMHRRQSLLHQKTYSLLITRPKNRCNGILKRESRGISSAPSATARTTPGPITECAFTKLTLVRQAQRRCSGSEQSYESPAIATTIIATIRTVTGVMLFSLWISV